MCRRPFGLRLEFGHSRSAASSGSLMLMNEMDDGLIGFAFQGRSVSRSELRLFSVSRR